MHATPWRKRIVTQALVLQLAVIAAVLLIISAAFALTGQDALEEQYGIRAQAIAESVAENPDVRSLVADSTISPEVQEIAEAVRLRTGVSFVVVTDVNGIRHSHPNPERIGKPVSTDPGRALAGISDWYVQTGTLGPSVRGKVPIWGPTGEDVVGIVSVGVLTGEVSETFRDHIASLVFAGAVAFAAGAIAAYLGARRIRRQTLGLEPPEIASLFEHRDGMLRSLHEGVVAVDSAGVVTLVNEEAASALGLDVTRVDQLLSDLPHLEPLHALAQAPNPQRDVPVQIGTQTLLVTSAPITIRNEQAGAVLTFRDRTELQGLASELESAQNLVEALRAQAHEHSNDLHTISGLIELGRHGDVLEVISDHSTSQRELADLFARSSTDPLIVASLLAKTALAAERDIRLRTHLGDLPKLELRTSRDLVTIVGNLVDNALDQVGGGHLTHGEIEVAIWSDDGMIRIDVSDSGSGLTEQQIAEIFTPGFTTKDQRSHEGLGLTLVQNVVERHRGTVTVDSEPGSGSLFSVELPVAAVEDLIDA